MQLTTEQQLLKLSGRPGRRALGALAGGAPSSLSRRVARKLVFSRYHSLIAADEQDGTL